MFEMFLILGAALIGYKLFTSGSADAAADSAKRALEAAATREPAEIDMRTDASRKKAGATDLWVEDFAELPAAVRKHVLTALGDPTTLPEDIRSGADAFLAGCSATIEKKSRAAGAVVGLDLISTGGYGLRIDEPEATPPSPPPFDPITKEALPTWCYPVAAARLLKIAAALEVTLRAEEAKAALPKPGPDAIYSSTIKRVDTGIASIVERIDLKKLIVDKIGQEIAALPDSEPALLRRKVKRLFDFVMSRPDLSIAGYDIARQRNDPAWVKSDPEWLRLVAESLEETYKTVYVSRAIRTFADALETFEASKTAAEEAYDEEIRLRDAAIALDADASREWPQLWAIEDPELQPALRTIARNVKKFTTDSSIFYGLRNTASVLPTREEISGLVEQLAAIGLGAYLYDQASKTLLGLQRAINDNRVSTGAPASESDSSEGVSTSGGFGGSISVTL